MSTYYVAPWGNDGSPSGSASAPWLNPDVAASRLAPGDTLFARQNANGTPCFYPRGIFNSIPSGTSWDNKVRIANYPGETVWLRPPNNGVSGGYGFYQSGSSRFIEIDGINIDPRSVSNCLALAGSSVNHIRLQNMEILGSPFASYGQVYIGGSDHHLRNVVIHGGGPSGGGLPGSTYGIYLAADRCLIELFDIYDVNGGGIHCFKNVGFPVDNVIRNGRIHHITRSGDTRIFGVLVNGQRNKTYNVLVDHLSLAAAVSGSAAAFVSGPKNKFWYCIAADNGAHFVGFKMDADATSEQEVRNCIARNNPGGDYQSNGSATTCSNNIGNSGASGWTNVDPEFLNPSAFDYRIPDTSPAIDAGVTIPEVTTDFFGGARPAGPAPDIGFHEFGSVGSSEPDPGSPPFGSPTLPPPVGSPASPGDVVTEPSPIPPGGVTTSIEFYSDHDMQDPPEYYGGFKEGRIRHAGEGTRNFSDMFTGEWSGSSFDLSLSDFDRKFRQQLNSVTDRNWVEPLQIWMTTRANRALLGTMYTVFVGPIIDIGEMKSSDPLTLDLTLGDIISEALLSDDYQLPWRVIRDGFIGELDEVAEALDLDAPEPIIYGQHRRVPDVDPASPQGFQVTPIYLGIEGGYHVWMVCGHACAAIPEVLVWTPDEFGGLGTSESVLADGEWLIPHTSAPAYEDRHSVTYGNDRRYTLIRGLVGTEEEPTDADACAIGDKTLTCFVDGVEPVGDGTGAVITDRFQQYKHFLINFVANRGQASYQSGAWLENPVWDLFDGPVTIIEEDSFDACSAIAEERLPLPDIGSPGPDYAAGYIGAAIIGARASDRASVRRWIADWNRSCGCSFGPTHFGQIRVSLLHPTAEIKAAAPLYTDAYEILQGSFGTRIPWREKVNRVPWRADYEYTSGQWKTSDVASIDAGITQYGKELLGEIREYPFAPGETAANHLAQLEAKIRVQPLRIITLEATVGHDDQGDSLGYRDLGDYVRYKHFDAVSVSKSQDRLAYVIGHQVQAGKRRVRIIALDVEEYIGFDAPETFSGVSPGNDTCATAVEIPAAEIVNYTTEIDTTLHVEDLSVDGLCGSPAGAFHAAWFEITPTQAMKGHVTTGTSGYDTILGVFTGECESLVLEECNDNDGIFTTSFIEFGESNFLLPGVTYRFLVTGRTPADGGKLVFTLFLEPL